MTLAPVAQEDVFVVSQGQTSTTVTGNLGADNGAGADYDPDGTVLGWVAGPDFSPVGDGNNYLGAFFTDGVLGFLVISGTVSYPFPEILTATSIHTAEGGIVVIATDGTFTYTSPPGFSGTDSFTYTLVDENFQTTTTTVTLVVEPTAGANDRPVAVDDVFVVAEDTVFTGNVLADNGAGADSDPDGDAITVKPVTFFSEEGGKVSLYADGTFTYTPPANYTGPDSFTYTVTDASGATDTGTVHLNVAPVDDAPIARDDAFSVLHDQSLTGNVLADNGGGLDSDQEGSALTVVPAVLTTAQGGSVTLLADGSFTYEPATGYVGYDSFLYTVTDASGQTDTGQVVITVTNAAPVAKTDLFTVKFGATSSGNLLANNGNGVDSDADGDAITVTPMVLVSDQGSVLTIAADGSFTYVPGEIYYGTETFTYTLTDSVGASTTGTVQFTVASPGGYQGGSGYDSWTGTSAADTAMMGAGDDTASGGAGNDLIGGGLDDDTVSGGTGNDRLYGEEDKDLLNGDDGRDALYGGAAADELFGGAGNDTLSGGTGADKLKGGGGADQFVLTTTPGDSDRIADFTSTDKLVIDDAALGLAPGTVLDASYLVNKGAADSSHGRFVYDAKTKTLWWDDDGQAATADTLLATFDTKVTLTIDSFILI